MAGMLLKTANVFGAPILATEQNPKAFGNLIPEVAENLQEGNHKKIEKTSFSMINSDTEEYLKENGNRKTAILFGIEAHVCVMQTCFDLMKRGYKVVLIADAVSSSRLLDRKVAIERMQHAGATVMTTESLIFEILKGSKHPKFKEMLPIIKTSRAYESNL